MVAVEINVVTYAVLFSLLVFQIWTLLWATGMVSGLRSTLPRLIIAAALGAAYDVLVDLAAYGVVGGAGLLGSGWAVLVISVTSFAVAYWPVPRTRLLPAIGYYYLLAFLGAGAAYAVNNVTSIGWLGPVAAVTAILIAAEIGWGVVQHWLWQRVLYVPIAVEFMGNRVSVTALVDTGNSLRDPLTGTPVVILSGDLLPRLLPADLAGSADAILEGDVANGAAAILASPAATRMRLVPFNSLGRENGMLFAFRADSVAIRHGATTVPVAEALIGFHRSALATDGAFEALIHPSLVRDSARGTTLTGSYEGTVGAASHARGG